MRRLGVFLLLVSTPAWMPWAFPATVGDLAPVAFATQPARPPAVARATPVSPVAPAAPARSPTPTVRAVAAGPVVAAPVMVRAAVSTHAPATAAPPLRPHAVTPAIAADFPDPDVIHAAGRWWAYATGVGFENLQVRSSTDLATWSAGADPLPHLPAWAAPGYTWAPAVAPTSAGFVMYYSVRDGSTGRQCLSVATSATPGGPFADSSTTPLTCQLGAGGSIDPTPFTAPDGTEYLLWKSEDNALGHPSRIGVQELSADGLALVGPRPRLLSANASWQAGVVEGPSMIADGGRFYLFYGANHWDTASAGIGYAVCAGAMGPCTNASRSHAWVASSPGAVGPSGPDVFTGPDGRAWIAYHAWNAAPGRPGSVRQLWIMPLAFVGGVPVIG